jgi:hypothetical protein
MMKGKLVKGKNSPAVKKPAVNYLQLARQEVSAMTCQEGVDTKAFTGKGHLLELRQMVTAIDELEAEMRALSEATKRVSGCQMYLMLHHRSSTSYTFLRWRELGGSTRHLSWDEAEALREGFPSTVKEWYRAGFAQAMALNAKHVEYREGIRVARRAIAMKNQWVFARPIPEGDA